MLSYEGEQFDVISAFLELQHLVRETDKRSVTVGHCVFSSDVRTHPETPVNDSTACPLAMSTNCSLTVLSQSRSEYSDSAPAASCHSWKATLKCSCCLIRPLMPTDTCGASGSRQVFSKREVADEEKDLHSHSLRAEDVGGAGSLEGPCFGLESRSASRQ